MLGLRPKLPTIHEYTHTNEIAVQADETVKTGNLPVQRKQVAVNVGTKKPTNNDNHQQTEKTVENTKSVNLRSKKPLKKKSRATLAKHSQSCKTKKGSSKSSGYESEIDISQDESYQNTQKNLRKFLTKNENCQTMIDSRFMQIIEILGIPMFKMLDTEKLNSANMNKQSYIELASLINRFLACRSKEFNRDIMAQNHRIIKASQSSPKLIRQFSNIKKPIRRSISDGHQLNYRIAQNQDSKPDFRVTKKKSLKIIQRALLSDGSPYEKQTQNKIPRIPNSFSKLNKPSVTSSCCYAPNVSYMNCSSTSSFPKNGYQTNSNGETTRVSTNGITHILNSNTGEWMLLDIKPILSKVRNAYRPIVQAPPTNKMLEWFDPVSQQWLPTVSQKTRMRSVSSSNSSFQNGKLNEKGSAVWREVPILLRK